MIANIGIVTDAQATAHKLAIQEVLSLHSRGLDRLDVNALRHCYWQEAEVDYGAYKGPAHDFADIVVQVLKGQYQMTRHSLSNCLIELSDEMAFAETGCIAGHLLPSGDEELMVYGRYLDRLGYREGQWKLLHRQVVMDWSKRMPVVDERDSADFADLSKGAHRPSDPLYAFLDTAD